MSLLQHMNTLESIIASSVEN
ncbi:Bgt-51725 [Blumeria graminis f. sp. tritici]|uniref:Bgt-51725 n=1 Tax=Blumeria graminis f. sp. tritici TaxID=62690 RepID=A0A9X9LAQ1_BLUGR|nr:Bgt-51725 [Blumeria graminis f. sp. tritici]